MTSIFNINNLTNSIKDVSRPTEFSVKIYTPNWITDADNFDSAYLRDTEFLCDNANIPGFSVNIFENKRKGFYGKESFPVGKSYGNLTTTFIVDSDKKIILFFQQWMQSIVNYLHSGYQYPPTQRTSNGRYDSEISYRDYYVTDIDLNLYHRATNEKLIYRIRDAYPIDIGDVQLGWEQNNTVLKLPVEFTYKSFGIYSG